MSTENKYQRVLAATGSESILAVIEGLPVDANGFFLTEAQMTAVEEALASNETALATANGAVATALTERDSAVNAQQTAEGALAVANNTIASKDQEVARLNARISELEAGTENPTQTSSQEQAHGPQSVASWQDPANPANAAADRFFGRKKDTCNRGRYK